MEFVLKRPLDSGFPETLKNGVAIEFLNLLKPDEKSEYIQKPKNVFNEMENVKTFNDKATKIFGLESLNEFMIFCF
jgi:hypothetical protein